MSDSKDRLFRHLALLRLIPRQPRSISAPELLQRLRDREFDIDLRTLQRDLSGRLSLDFPLLCDESQRPYRWSFPQDMPHFDFPALDVATALALILARSHLDKLLPPGISQLLEPHFNLAHRQLQGLDHNNLTHWASRVRALPNGKTLVPAEVDGKIWQKVCTALLAKKQLRVVYLSRSKGQTGELLLHPAGLVARHSISYLVASVEGYSDLRQFALQRIRHVEVLDTSALGHDRFNIDEYIASGAFSSRQAVQQVTLVADIAPQTAWLLRETPISETQILQALPDSDWQRLRAQVPDDQETLWWILGLSDNIRVYQPETWLTAIRQKIKQMQAMYADGKHPDRIKTGSVNDGTIKEIHNEQE